MARSFKTQLAGQIGESIVVAELGRRGIIATAFAGNVPDIDLLAYKDEKTLALQVKAWRTGTVSVNASRYLRITIEDEIQTVDGLEEQLDPKMILVFVFIGEQLGLDRFFILEQSVLQNIIRKHYEANLLRHNGRRPRNPATTHNSVSLEELLPYEGNWQLIERRFEPHEKDAAH